MGPVKMVFKLQLFNQDIERKGYGYPPNYFWNLLHVN